MFKNIIIIGKGSAGLKHYRVLKNSFKKTDISIFSSRKFYNQIKKIHKKNIDYIVVCSPASTHLKFIKFIEKNFQSINVLIEKPLHIKKIKKPKSLRNNYFVGYNLRYHPVIQFIKSFLKNKKPFFVRIICSSNLKKWRKNVKYYKSVSALRKLGGGALLELSHEIDYVNWIFGNLNLINVYNKKISNLKIDTDDILCLHAKLKKNIFINMELNFFSMNEIRKIFIDLNNLSIEADLITNQVIIFKDKKIKKINFKNFKINQTYRLQHLDIYNNKKIVCNFNEAIKIQNTISSIKEIK